MKEYLIGTGGWAYFKIPGINPLVAYSRLFSFVEVNSTFYQIPPLREVERWRRLAPPYFQFSVRAHRSITHTYGLQPKDEALETFASMKQICRLLKTDILHLQTPPLFKMDPLSIGNFRQLLSSLDLEKLRLALEIRNKTQQKLPSELIKTMQDNNIIHCTDVSKGEMPSYDSDIMYTRLFGKGSHNIYQPTDGELVEIDRRASSSKSQKVVMSFHFVRMYKDAARMKTYKQTGKFPTVTNSTGISSLEEVLKEDAEFPATKQDLVRKQGWKLFDLTKNERVHAGEILEKLPEGTYNGISEVAEKLQTAIR